MRVQRVFPLPQLFVPALLDFQAQVRLRVHEDAHRRLRQLQAVVDGDDRLDARRRAGDKLRLLVVQRFGVRAAALGDGAERARLHRQRPLVVLAKLRQV